MYASGVPIFSVCEGFRNTPIAKCRGQLCPLLLVAQTKRLQNTPGLCYVTLSFSTVCIYKAGFCNSCSIFGNILFIY